MEWHSVMAIKKVQFVTLTVLTVTSDKAMNSWNVEMMENGLGRRNVLNLTVTHSMLLMLMFSVWMKLPIWARDVEPRAIMDLGFRKGIMER